MEDRDRTADRSSSDRIDIHEEQHTEPRKRHGDALADRSGSRHGVDRADERPGRIRPDRGGRVDEVGE